MVQEQGTEIELQKQQTKALSRKRDRKLEDSEARGKLALRAAELRIARESEDLEVTQIAQCLILCGLPYVPTKETRIIRHARLANGSEVRVTFSSGLGSEMPYGSDRTLLYFLLDKAVKSGSRFVSWKDATEFLTQMKMQTASGKNYSDLRKRFSRLRGLTIGVERTNENADISVLMPIIRRSALPSSMAMKALRRGQEPLPLSQEVDYGVELDEIFFQDLLRFHVPVPTELLAQTRKQSQLQDICLFLHWRCYAAKSEAVIPWEALRQQFWHEDKTVRRIKVRVSEAIKFLRLLWPELKAEPNEMACGSLRQKTRCTFFRRVKLFDDLDKLRFLPHLPALGRRKACEVHCTSRHTTCCIRKKQDCTSRHNRVGFDQEDIALPGTTRVLKPLEGVMKLRVLRVCLS